MITLSELEPIDEIVDENVSELDYFKATWKNMGHFRIEILIKCAQFLEVLLSPNK